ncbi:glycosyltransferase family 4 protein [Mucilaginibacter boryungensis]|uniref:Glycosyltransferase n=1 Tax=Mucilaginibacter boryungensis TaxID=768480 RepID=A0ABR9XIB3_9SPHI|nr:glycosyltransferase [Mucilaginibacter boryungensis]MBE9666819.1 glycosyltransferase [Mucilaginibacter boryungensis]
MKVLWFSLSAGLSDAYLNNNYEGIGWIKSLEKNIQDKIDLSIAFYHNKEIPPFKLGATTYYPIKKYKHGNLTKMKRRLFNSIESQYDNQLFLNVVKEAKPDLIHIHGTESPFGLVQKYTNIPTVVSIQGTITVYRYKFFSKISWFDVLKHSDLKSFIFSRTFIHVYKQFAKIAAREQEIYKHSKHFIGRTAWDRRVTKVLAPSARYYHNDEILRSGFYTNKWVFKPAAKLQLFTTIWGNVYKGLETLLDCARLLDEINIDYEWQLAGIGRNDEVVRIASKGNKQPVSPNVKFLSMINEASLIEGLLESHMYIATSHIENSPNSLCEALILGVPCIATNAGGTGSLMDDNKEGILIQDGDPYAMAGAIMELKDNYKKAIAYGKQARERALLRHDQEKITSDLLSIYATILNGQSKPLFFTSTDAKLQETDETIMANN